MVITKFKRKQMEEIKFRHTLPIQLRFNDVDKFGHVNNTVYFSFYDLGKTEYFASVCPGVDWEKDGIVVVRLPGSDICIGPHCRTNGCFGDRDKEFSPHSAGDRCRNRRGKVHLHIRDGSIRFR